MVWAIREGREAARAVDESLWAIPIWQYSKEKERACIKQAKGRSYVRLNCFSGARLLFLGKNSEISSHSPKKECRMIPKRPWKDKEAGMEKQQRVVKKAQDGQSGAAAVYRHDDGGDAALSGKGQSAGDLTQETMTGAGIAAWVLEGFCLVAVNVYMLISGYFLCESSFKPSRLSAAYAAGVGFTLLVSACWRGCLESFLWKRRTSIIFLPFVPHIHESLLVYDCICFSGMRRCP